jgi:hypothetical protein
MDSPGVTVTGSHIATQRETLGRMVNAYLGP